MQKRITFILLVIGALFLFMPMAKGKPFPAVRYYNVYHDDNCGCIVSPPVCTGLYGQWTRYCDDTWEGSGAMPGSECTRYEVTIGEWCDF
jgi:hypothetical protein